MVKLMKSVQGLTGKLMNCGVADKRPVKVKITQTIHFYVWLTFWCKLGCNINIMIAQPYYICTNWLASTGYRVGLVGVANISAMYSMPNFSLLLYVCCTQQRVRACRLAQYSTWCTCGTKTNQNITNTSVLCLSHNSNRKHSVEDDIVRL